MKTTMRVWIGAAMAVLVAIPSQAAEIVSMSAKNVGLARWEVEMVYTQDTASDPANAVHSILMHPENGGNDCLRIPVNPFLNGTIALKHICTGVPYGTRYFTVFLRTVNGRNPPPGKVWLAE